MSWVELLDCWDLIETDLHDVYGIDIEDMTVMRARTWRWLRERITGLLTLPPASFVRVPVDETHERIRAVWRTRIQDHVYGQGG